MYSPTGQYGRSVRHFLLAGALLSSLAGCKSERTPAAAQIVTEVLMVRPAAERVVAAPEPDAIDETNEFCRKVELQARETNESLPKRLDRDTRATRIAAYGCDVVLEYAMLGLRVSDVAIEGVRAMRNEVLEKLCSDLGARGVMDHGGSFTNVYRDDRSALIDQFTIGAEDCSDRRSALGAPASVDL